MRTIALSVGPICSSEIARDHHLHECHGEPGMWADRLTGRLDSTRLAGVALLTPGPWLDWGLLYGWRRRDCRRPRQHGIPNDLAVPICACYLPAVSRSGIASDEMSRCCMNRKIVSVVLCRGYQDRTGLTRGLIQSTVSLHRLGTGFETDFDSMTPSLRRSKLVSTLKLPQISKGE